MGRGVLSWFASKIASRFDAGTIKLNGADYDVVDTEDGYKTVKDMPLFSEIPKGTHGAPYDVTKAELDKFLVNMQSRYAQGKRCGALSVGHNDDLGLTHPAFAGFFLPTRVGQYKFPDGKERWTLFGDSKIANDKFELFAAGKLHSHSPEIYAKSWDERKIDVVSFLDTKPPYFDFAMNTVGKITKDPTAKFEAVFEERDMTLDGVAKQLIEGDIFKILGKEDADKLAAKFAAYAEAAKPKEEKPEAVKEDKFAKDYPSAHAAISKLMSHFNLKFDSAAAKPDPTPVETSTTSGGMKMELDPKTAARFALMETEHAELKSKIAAKENEDRAKSFVSRADNSLSKKVIPEPMKAQIAKFAAQAAVDKDGEKKFDEFVDALKSGLRDKPPSSVSEFMAAGLPSVEPTDPVLSKFAAVGANMEDVAKFAAQHRQLKLTLGDRFTADEESYIKNEIAQVKYEREHPEGLRGNRR